MRPPQRNATVKKRRERLARDEKAGNRGSVDLGLLVKRKEERPLSTRKKTSLSKKSSLRALGQ